MIRSELATETYETANEIIRTAIRAIANAQEESRRLRVPNVYSINRRLYYETPSGELSATDPYWNKVSAAAGSDATEPPAAQ